MEVFPQRQSLGCHISLGSNPLGADGETEAQGGEVVSLCPLSSEPWTVTSTPVTGAASGAFDARPRASCRV